MTLSFHIEYRTNWGEEVRVSGSVPELGNGKPENAQVMHTVDGIHWRAEVDMVLPKEGVLNYCYHIFRNGKLVRTEWNNLPRILHLGKSKQHTYRLEDCWKNLPEQHYFYTSAFTDALMAHHKRSAAPKALKRGWMIKAYAPNIDENHILCVCGNQQLLGLWDADKAVPMSDVNFPEWQVELDASKLTFPLEYKFVLYNKKEKRVVAWENNPNRYQLDSSIEANETLVTGDRNVFFNLPQWKGAGTAIPVFSLRSEKSMGVGDFGDLKLMIDWAVKTNQRAVQILPINDTTITHTWTDSYPYNSISIYAFHPMYTDLRQLGKLKDKKKMASFDKRQKELNALAQIDYEAVNQTKWEYFHLIFEQEGSEVLASEEFKQFYEANKQWLQPYAAFSFLRDTYGTPDFRQWPSYSNYKAEEIEALCQERPKETGIYLYIQYNLHRQLVDASAYAHDHGVVLKGDIPIGISRNSVEAWTEPHYFNLNGQAGAPPDDFSANGQNWGFPTYNWEVMEKDGYAWWMRRFKKMSEYFDAYRIDHILGFFRIWEIPMHSVHGLLGQFVPSLPMSREEIESYGLGFDEARFTKPYIHEYFLGEVFGPHTDYVKETFLNTTNVWEIYELKPEFDTQRKVEQYFAGKNDEATVRIREGLYSLISDVLFIRDRNNPNLFHPRISVQNDYVYRSLNDWEKSCFNRLYNHYYYHRHNDFWGEQAMKKLPQLTQSTNMLVCGEDLGMIPDCVPWVMNDLRILSLEIQRMPKDPKQEFGNPYEYPYRSVSTISTHDMSTLRGWWEENAEQTQHFYNRMLGHYGAAPAVADAKLCEEVVTHHLRGSSILCILSWQDWLSIDGVLRNPDTQTERINVPANPRHYWRWRMHLSLEQLMKADELNEKIKALIAQAGR